jgi:hypothetical protein
MLQIIFFLVLVRVEVDAAVLECDPESITYRPGVQLTVVCTDEVFSSGFES